jgi:signal transduction histidine kinase
MDFYIIFSFINGIVAILFGWFIFSKNWKNITNATFFLMSMAVAIWSFSYCLWLSKTDATEALFWSRMLNLGATLIPIFFFHWVLSILNIIKEKKKVLIFGYILTIFYSFYSFSPLYIESVAPVSSFPFWPQAGPIYVFFLIFGYFGLTFYGLYQLIKAKRGADSEKKHQIDYVILGSLFGFGGGATNFPLMFGISLFPPIGQPLVIFYIIIFGLATLRYHLFEIKVILVEILVGVMGIALSILLFFMPTEMLRLLMSIVLFLFLIFGYYFIKAIHQETARKEEAERISKLKTEFISIVSHQLRTPLAAIRGYTDMIKDGDYGPITKELGSPINYIHETSIGMIKMVNGLLSISRLERGKIELKVQEEDILKLVQDCINDVELVAKEKDLYLKYTKPKNKYPLIRIDEDKIRHALTNILNNAILYTPKGGITIKVSKNDLVVRIEVKDTGVGIEKEEIGKLFLSFSRGQKGLELYTQGTGLGLYVAKSFIDMHKGKVWCESEGKDKGTTFFIELPIKSVIVPKQDINIVSEKAIPSA